MRELPPSLPPSTTFFPLSLLQTSRSLLLVLPLLPFHSFSLSLSLSFFFYITSIFFQLSSSHCLLCSYPLRVSPSVFHYFLFFFSISLVLSLSIFLSFSLFGCVSFRLIAIGHSRNARSGLSWVKG